MSEIVIGIAEGKIVFHSHVLVTYALGSCVAVCLYESQIKMAGMVHILLPSQQLSFNQNNVYKFADSGICKLIENMELYGSNRANIVAKIVGGAEMFQTADTKTGIGSRNIVAVKKTLSMLQIPIVAEHIGSNYGRSIWFSCEDGSVKVKTVNKGVQII